MEFTKHSISLSPASRIERELIAALEATPGECRALLLRQLVIEAFKANKSVAHSQQAPAPMPVSVPLAAPQPVAVPQPQAAHISVPVTPPAPRKQAARPMPEPEPEDEVIEMPELAPILDRLAHDDEDEDEDPLSKLQSLIGKRA